MSDWRPVILGSLLEIKHGYAFPGKEITTKETNDVLVTPGNFEIGGGFKASKLKYFEGEVPEEYVLAEGDLIVTMTDLSRDGDTLGYSALVPKFDGKRLLHNQRIGLVLVKSDEVSSAFLHWLMRSREYRFYVLGSATGSTVRHTSPERIKQIELEIPSDPKEQEAIAEILSSLDEKIELNRKQNRTLEAIAQALFKRWFVEFEFPACLSAQWLKGAGKPNDSLMQYGYKSFGGLPAPQSGLFFVYVLECENGAMSIGQTRNLLKRWHEHVSGEGARYTKGNKPVRFLHWEQYESRELAVEREQWLKTGFGRKWLQREHAAGQTRQAGGAMQPSELGEIPVGWRVGKLEELIDELETGSRPKGGVGQFFEGVPSIGAESITRIGEYDYSKTKFVPKEYFEKMRRGIIKDRDVLIYKDGGQPGRFDARISMFGGGFPYETACLNEHVFRLQAKKPTYQNYLYLWLSSYPVIEELRFRGAKAAIPGINSGDIKELDFLFMDEEVLEKFDEVIEPLFSKLLQNSREMAVLGKLRDTLLPKLMSGELRVA
ncbi:restriction modification system DNA specificity domain protein [Nitrosococcus halophilus Nc 4]|uniref:Restriction modification system DNA specificity domain protein n=1 Tax=Nitrosococcus halophilus (strain Nc4) TaxID=472759 RepID=D5BY88_NITHN|nr:restriction endonuclease subunit S [Nitrosococcus halophilus]ADE14071.1 restriction modification system DNA specificity domain protein [Nitrosococcus halophilus Nc 4]